MGETYSRPEIITNVEAARPAASAVQAGDMFRASDTGVISISDGERWTRLTRGRGDGVVGIESYPRWVPGEAALSTSFIYLSFVTAEETRVVSKAVTNTAGTAAGATPTRCRVGVWEVDPVTGNGTLVASTANTPSLWSATFTRYETSLSTPLTIKIGQRYALGAVIASAAAMPVLYGGFPPNSATGLPPRTSGYLPPSGGDLPATFTEATIAATGAGTISYIALIP